MKKCALLLAALLVSSAAFAADPAKPAPKAPKPTKKNPVVVFVDMRRVLDESALFQRIQANLKAAEEAAAAASKPKMKEYSEKRLVYMSQESKMTPEEKEKLGRELQALQQETGDMQQRLKADLQSRQGEANKLFGQVLEEVGGALSKEFGWDAIVNKAPDIAMWTSEAVDQTDLVIERLNARPFPNHPLAAAPAPSAPPPAGK